MRYRFLYIQTLLACLLAFLSTQISFAVCKSCSESDKLCGPRSLLIICQKLGIESNLEEMKAICGYNDESGTTMLGLLNAAKAKGLQAVGMKIGLDELSAFKGSSIAHLWDNHFVVVEPGGADKIIMTDPPNEPTSVNENDFKKSYSGFALLLAKDTSAFPKVEVKGSDLRFESYTLNIGSVYEGDVISYSLKCRNVGNEELAISDVKASCDCLVVQGWPRNIPPSGEGEIKVFFDSKGQSRGLVKRLYVTSNDPISPVVHLDVVGYVKPNTLLMSPRSVNFEKPRRTESTSREIYIPSTKGDSVEVTSVTSDTPYITTVLSQSMDKQRPGYTIIATLKPGAPIGELRGKLTIISNHSKQPKAELPVTATIKGDIDIDRDSFFLGIVKKGEERKTAVTISTAGTRPLKIKKIDSSLSYVSTDIYHKTEGKAYVITVTLKPDAPAGNIKSDIIIHTDDSDQPVIKVPLYAYVESKS